MSTYWNYASKKLISFFFLTLFLTGCISEPAIKNGDNIGDLSGKAGSSKLFSISIPENIDSLLIEVSGSDDVALELLDENELDLGICSGDKTCIVDRPAPAKYLVKLTATADYETVNISASWGGSDETVLSNATQVNGLKGGLDTVLLKSLFVPINNGPLTIETEGLAGANLALLDEKGVIIESCGVTQSCAINNVVDGLFYVRIEGVNEFSEGSLTASWGNATTGSMQDGVAKAIAGLRNDTVVESIYVADNVDAFAVQFADVPLEVEILDESGAFVASCNAGEVCIQETQYAGLYFLRFRFLDNIVEERVLVRLVGSVGFPLLSRMVFIKVILRLNRKVSI